MRVTLFLNASRPLDEAIAAVDAAVKAAGARMGEPYVALKEDDGGGLAQVSVHGSFPELGKVIGALEAACVGKFKFYVGIDRQEYYPGR